MLWDGALSCWAQMLRFLAPVGQADLIAGITSSMILRLYTSLVTSTHLVSIVPAAIPAVSLRLPLHGERENTDLPGDVARPARPRNERPRTGNRSEEHHLRDV